MVISRNERLWLRELLISGGLGLIYVFFYFSFLLHQLPKKLLFCLAAFLFSIATMIIAFGVTRYIVLSNRLNWVSIPIFTPLKFPLFIQMFSIFRLQSPFTLILCASFSWLCIPIFCMCLVVFCLYCKITQCFDTLIDACKFV